MNHFPRRAFNPLSGSVATHQFLGVRHAFVLAVLFVPAMGHAQSGASPWAGVIENYIHAARPAKGIYYDETWAEERKRLSDQWRVVLTQDYVPGQFTLDANFLEYDQPNMYVRLGRLRTAFGFAQWSDTNYNVIFADPMVRTDQLLPNLGLDRLDDGAEIQMTRGDYQATLSLTDVYVDDLKMLPKKLDHVQARVQKQFESLIVGINSLSMGLNTRGSDGTLYSFDARWTGPRLMVRGECVVADSPGNHTDGYYVDVTYRPPKLFRMELGIRNEAFGQRSTGTRSRLTEVGIRYIFGPQLTMNFNYGTGKAFGDLEPLEGWSAQSMFCIHF